MLNETEGGIPSHYAEFHWPRFYRYKVADRRLQLAANRYPPAPSRTRGSAWIGLALVMGRYAYCVKWADARLAREGRRG